mmetsp:Transcript_2078/g.4686  ORF Transcript_2078/g.4686 Transcript_2078/m.4686 type:complete len:203 (+) Transcript_2078:589-1197(+)
MAMRCGHACWGRLRVTGGFFLHVLLVLVLAVLVAARLLHLAVGLLRNVLHGISCHWLGLRRSPGQVEHHHVRLLQGVAHVEPPRRHVQAQLITPITLRHGEDLALLPTAHFRQMALDLLVLVKRLVRQLNSAPLAVGALHPRPVYGPSNDTVLPHLTAAMKKETIGVHWRPHAMRAFLMRIERKRPCQKVPAAWTAKLTIAS